MGMAASQVRLLQLTSRKNDIGRQLSSLSLQKMALSNDMKKITKKYQDALSSKTLKWSTNSGVSYVDLSYANLMRPSSVNQNTPYLITNTNGQVVIDNQYKKYAEMISATGAAGGDYESNRSNILASLTGVSPESLDASVTADSAVQEAEDKVNNLQNEVDILEAKCTTEIFENDFFTECLGSIGSGFQWDGASTTNVGGDYKLAEQNGGGHWLLGSDATSSKSKLKELLEQLKKNVSNYLTDSDYQAFTEACNSTYTEYCGNIDQAVTSGTKDDKSIPVSIFSDKSNQLGLRVDKFIDTLMGAYRSAGGRYEQSTTDTNAYYYTCIDKNSTEYIDYQNKLAELDAAKEEYEAAVDASNQTLTSTDETQIAFYDKLFNAIAEKGWVANSQVSDTDYLNQMLQNNQYFITTISTDEDENGKIFYEYDSTPASNFEYIVSVNDSDAQEEAQIEYEYAKSTVDEKESRIDTRMQNLETEQSAINNMIQSAESIRNDNEERSLGIFA